MEAEGYLQKVGEWFLTSGLQIFLIMILMIIGLKAADIFSSRMFKLFKNKTDPQDPEIQKRADTLSSILRHIFNIMIFIMAGMMILKELGVDIGPMLAAAGVVGLAVGFGAQKLVEDVISGFFILLEDQIRVGDVVQIADKGGFVEKVTLRMVILRDLSGTVHYVRNGKIDVVSNMTKDFSYYVCDIGVAYREDVDQVITVIKAVDEDLRKDKAYSGDILAPIEILGLDKFADSAVIIKARIKTKPIKQWAAGREFNKRLKAAFDARGIEIPFPHVTIYMGEGKDGSAPALRMQMKDGKRFAETQ
jgi:small conductance mechanosensitive channel